jgi:hypothetical protein
MKLPLKFILLNFLVNHFMKSNIIILSINQILDRPVNFLPEKNFYFMQILQYLQVLG